MTVKSAAGAPPGRGRRSARPPQCAAASGDATPVPLRGGLMTGGNTEFELGGINHLALVSSDMKSTIDFYSGVLGMPLIKTLELPFGLGQHFFFDCGVVDCLAF